MKTNRTADIFEIIEMIPLRSDKHMDRVGKITEILSHKLSVGNHSCLREDELQYCGEAASFHDIGKAFIPVELVKKPGRFTPEEMEIMKKHTVCAEVIFMDMERGRLTGLPENLLKSARDAAVYHHEWWNGNGYPYGRCHEEIPLIARITSVCDAYDAITSKRVYRQARPHYDACVELAACSGKQFDPNIINIFLANEKEIESVLKKARLDEFNDLPTG